MMRRGMALLLALVLSGLGSFVPAARAAASYTLPEPLKTVKKSAVDLSFPADLPPYVQVKNFTVNEEGAIHLELGDEVPRLKIMEMNVLDGVESTIFTKKNAAVADAHKMSKDDTVFLVRLIWPFGGMEYIREYANWFGSLSFNSCRAEAEVDPAPYAPYTSVTRVLTFTESGMPQVETWTLKNEEDSLTVETAYDGEGKLRSVRQTWESVTAGEYEYMLETDRYGEITALTVQDKKNHFYARSLRIDQDPNAPMTLSMESLNADVFDEILRKQYPQLARGLIDYESVEAQLDEEFLAMWNLTLADLAGPEPSTMTDLPATMTDLSATMTDLPEMPAEDLPLIPANARIWALNFGTFLKSDVYAFITLDPVLVLQDGKAAMNPDAKDVNGDPVRLSRKNKITAPAMEAVGAE